MTNEQAIKVINGHIKDSSVAYGTFTGQALRMAIEALKAQYTIGDTISRQAAIDAVDRERKKKHLFNTAEDGLLEARGVINTLPSAQPEPSIPLSWIEGHIEWLKSLDNEFANLAATHIYVMVKRWRGEQDE